MIVNYIVHYLIRSSGGQVGCENRSQAIETAKWIESYYGENCEISIQNVKTGDVEPFI